MPDLSLALVALIPLATVELAKAARWAALLGSDRPSYGRCLQALVSGQLTNLVSPLRAGEAVQLGLVTFRGGALAPALTTLLGTKLMDGTVLLAMAVIVFGTVVLGNAAPWLVAGSVLICVVAGVEAFGRGPQLQRTLRRLPLADRLGIDQLQPVGAALRNRRVVVGVAASSAVVWLAGLLANTLVLAAAGIEPTLDLSVRVLLAGYIVGVVPGPPGRLGVFETGIVLALTSAGVSPADALPAALTLHVAQFCELGLLGLATVVIGRWSKPV